jgi:hypothetical protein
MEKRAPEAIVTRDKLRHEKNDPQALRTFNNQDGTRGFYFNHQPVLGVGMLLVDPSEEKKAPTEPAAANSNLAPVATRRVLAPLAT